MSLLYLLSVSALLGGSYSKPLALESLSAKKSFTMEQVAIPRRRFWGAPEKMRRTYMKYGLDVPHNVFDAAEAWANGTNQASVPVRPVKGDVEYLINVTVGNHVLSLDMDTGSSDLWVFSTLQPEDQRTNRPVARVYDPSGSNAQRMEGHSWQIRYGDMSGANGQVYTDRVGVGGIFFEKQAVEAATSVSRTFSKDAANDGLLGLAFSRLNTIKPNPQKTWFDNVKPQLAAPVFTSYLKRRAVGAYDFGFIDKAKYKGDITYVEVTGNKGFWTFTPSAYIVGNGEPVTGPINAIADTGTSLWYLPKAVADGYWAKVPGAQYNSLQAGWMFPCNAQLPDMSMVIGGVKIVVPGINMNYQTISTSQCYGGIQRDTGMPFSIFGDVFLKGVFVVFESAPGAQPRIGFAQQSTDGEKPGNTVAQDSSEPSPFGDGAFDPEEEAPFSSPFGDDERLRNGS